ncbi:MAG: ribosome biogenesis/translation initiation ATPase RLI [Candidatus Iainarchaeum archaeon]|uniref:Ribosome biogenesis/translation initiation ATPase RLI n=1 Tax=Candidatus Iainarchaeum sp. TaxID=3101447 RepID=A0A497JIY7_9ARCH|nr:MAG: ribosome biogenesis/translation initiation ATPase RLI [Candidatus Diapherotrites archaeon]
MAKEGKKRIAVINYDLCNPKKCGYLCERVCPVNKSGKECIIHENSEKPNISENLCIGCNICVRKCPFSAITIVNLPFEMKQPVHQYGRNMFRLFSLPMPKEKAVVGIIGRNGAGKTTALNILAGIFIPNLGDFEKEPNIERVIEFFKGSELQKYFERLKNRDVRVAYKPQYITQIPKQYKGKVKELLEKISEKNIAEIAEVMEIENILERDISVLSGGELQKVAIAATLAKNADLYFFDEFTAFLDVRERLRAAREIYKLKEGASVMLVEHDLTVLDYLSDYVHVLFGKPHAYGVVSQIKSVRNGINEYLEGFLKNENIRFREYEIKFEIKPPAEESKKKVFIEYPELRKSFEGFELKVEGSTLYKAEVVGILGRNGIGKTTFVKMLANELKPDNCKLEWKLKIAYKPQYLKAEDRIVGELFDEKDIDYEFYESEFRKKLDIFSLEESNLKQLSGGELQKVITAYCLCKDADIYLLDEPSAYLDIEQRLQIAHAINVLAEKKEKCCLVVDHDIMFIDFVANRLLVFEGTPAKEGYASGITSMHKGMNKFLKQIGITFRRDPQSGRPRANKPGSVKDKEQKKKGEFYYTFS